MLVVATAAAAEVVTVDEPATLMAMAAVAVIRNPDRERFDDFIHTEFKESPLSSHCSHLLSVG